MASLHLTAEVSFTAVTRARWILAFCMGLFITSELHAAAVRIYGIPSRRQLVLMPLNQPVDPSVKLPPPSAPNLGTGALGATTLPADVEIEKAPGAAVAIVPKQTAEQRKIKAGRERLNHNALLWQLERAQGGSATAMRSIGMRYLTGDGLEKNEIKAREWLKKGADGGDSAAIKELARLDAKKDLEKK
jgi:hypothetical protein